MVDAPENVTAGEPINVTANVTNEGDLQGTETVEFLRNGTVVVSESGVSLNVSETEQFEFTTETNDSDIGSNLNLTVRAGERSDSTTVTVLSPPDFNITNVTTDDPVAPGATATVEATIRNDGDSAGTEDVRLLRGPDDEVDVVEDVSLDAGETTTVKLAVETDETDAGETISLELVAGDGADGGGVAVDIEVPADERFNVSIDANASDTRIVEGENLTVV
ncbi:hypothetical protein DVK07_20415, partial [Halorubrum sp. Atlit-26R]